MSSSYHMQGFWGFLATIGSFVPSKLIFAGSGGVARFRASLASSGIQTVDHAVRVAQKIGRGQAE
jgi:hypothetical protein